MSYNMLEKVDSFVQTWAPGGRKVDWPDKTTAFDACCGAAKAAYLGSKEKLGQSYKATVDP